MAIEKRGIAIINVPYGDTPYHGWAGGATHYQIGLIVYLGAGHSDLYFDMHTVCAVKNSELLEIKHPFVVSYSVLGCGVATAIFDAKSMEEATAKATKFSTNTKAKDHTGRTIFGLGWKCKPNEDTKPVLLSVDDDLPYWEGLIQRIWRVATP